MRHGFFLGALLAMACAESALAAEAPKAGGKAPAEQSAFAPPYPQRTDPFRQPDNKALLATRRDAPQQQTHLRLKGFVNAAGLKAIVEIDGQTVMLQTGTQHGDVQVLEVTSSTITLQRGRHRWTESLTETMSNSARKAN